MGLFIWLEVPEDIDMQRVAARAADRDILLLPGIRLFPDGMTGHNCSRLCFGYNQPDRTTEDIGRLAEVCEGERMSLAGSRIIRE